MEKEEFKKELRGDTNKKGGFEMKEEIMKPEKPEERKPRPVGKEEIMKPERPEERKPRPVGKEEVMKPEGSEERKPRTIGKEEVMKPERSEERKPRPVGKEEVMKPERPEERRPRPDVQELELMIHLCTNKQELLKLLNDFNHILLDGEKLNYNVKVNKKIK